MIAATTLRVYEQASRPIVEFYRRRPTFRSVDDLGGFRELARESKASVESIRLLCRTHNQYEAERHFGMFARCVAHGAGRLGLMRSGEAEADAAILEKASELYTAYGLRRVYYSGYSPILHADPSLPAKRAPLVREHRLYQASHLLGR